MTVTIAEIRQGIQELGLSRSPVCVHSSLKSFGLLDRGASELIDGLLAEGCTIVVPSFSSTGYEVQPPNGVNILRNAMGVDVPDQPTPGSLRTYSSDTEEIDPDMGILPRTIVTMPGRQRSGHPLRSFSAVGPHASFLIPTHDTDLFGPLVRLAEAGGSVLLIGVGLDKLTAIHLAERIAKRNMFIRWANDLNLEPKGFEVGGCSEGFPKLSSTLSSLAQMINVGTSPWQTFPLQPLLELATHAIEKSSQATHCNTACPRCDSAALGGPIS